MGLQHPEHNNQMNPLEKSLQLIDQACALDQEILDALGQGDSAAAEKYCLQRQQLIHTIPFDQFQEATPPEFLAALSKLQLSNDKLTALTNSVQQEIGQQLAEIQKGIAGSKIYQDINRHE